VARGRSCYLRESPLEVCHSDCRVADSECAPDQPMIPLRLVIDTNVVVSAELKLEGLQRTAVLLAMTRPARWYVSDAIVSGYAVVLARPELKIRRGVPATASIDRESYSCGQAVAPKADHHRSGGQHVRRVRGRRPCRLLDYGSQPHFPRFWKNTKIITSSEFLSIITPHLLR
jgi:uncharacterized protein